MVIAIDGPSGSGKSTVARILAERLGFQYIDTGTMYRALAWFILDQKIPPDQEESIAHALKDLEISFDVQGRALVNGKNIHILLRSNEISRAASDVSRYSAVRRYLVGLQRAMGLAGDVVMEGRDIGTKVFPDADFKFFLTAELQIRGERRFKELRLIDPSVRFEKVVEAMRFRDQQDAGRDDSPLVKAPDAVEIDTTSMDIDQVVETLLSYLHKN